MGRAAADEGHPIVDGDVVVVGYSALRGAFRDFLSVTPLINRFTVF